MTNAEQKRQKQAREALTNQIGRQLVDFKDMYLGAYVKWNIQKMEFNLKGCIERIEDKMLSESREMTKNEDYTIKRLTIELSRKNLLSHQFINEAYEGYEVKFNRMIDKCVSFGIQAYPLTVETISNCGHELAFLVSNPTKEVHARAIFVHGAIQAPHYRFITTERIKNVIQ